MYEGDNCKLDDIIIEHRRATYTGTGDQNLCLSKRKLMSVVKYVDLEAMPTSIFLNDDDDYCVSQLIDMVMLVIVLTVAKVMSRPTVSKNSQNTTTEKINSFCSAPWQKVFNFYGYQNA